MSLNYFFDTTKGKTVGMKIGAVDIDADDLKTSTISTDDMKTSSLQTTSLILGNVYMTAPTGNTGDVITITSPGIASFQSIPPPPPTERGNETLTQCVVTESIIFPNGMIERDLYSLGSPVNTLLLRNGSRVSCSFSGAISSAGVGSWVLTLRLYICNISVDYPITIPATPITASQFRAKIDLIIRTSGVSGTTYMIGESEFFTDGGTYVRDITQIGFGGIDTTATTNHLKATGQFNGSPTGLSLNNRGGEIVLHNTVE